MKRIILCLLLMLAFGNQAAYGYGQSQEGTEGNVQLQHDVECDSVLIEFGFSGDGCDTCNFYAAVMAKPYEGLADSSYLYSDTLNLDSIGNHVVRAGYFLHSSNDNAIDFYLPIDSWLHESPAVLTGIFTVDYVLLNSADSTPIEAAAVSFRDWTLTNLLRTATSNASGIARVSLNADSVAALAASPSWTFSTTWDSFSYTSDHTDTLFGVSATPGPATGVDNVTAYLDAGSGMVDAGGNMVPRRNVRFFLDIAGGEDAYYIDSWALIWQTYEGRPTAAGRFTFTVPANTKLSPAGSYYVLRYEAHDGRSRSRGVIYKFQLDTLPDPILIFDATPIY